ncbi:MAG: hypothetical protein ACO1SX_22490, partial [Actinomycetota bacterium]
EDLLASTLQHARDVWPSAEQHLRLVTWGKFLARLLRDDYLTLEGVLQRLTPAAGFAAPVRVAVANAAEPPRQAPLYERPIPLAGGNNSDPFDF